MLHLDARGYYGDAWAGLTLEEFLRHISPPMQDVNVESLMEDQNVHVLNGMPCSYENVEVVQRAGDEQLGQSSDYIIELAPKVRICISLLERETFNS